MIRWVQRLRLWIVLVTAVALLTLGAASFIRRISAVAPSAGIEWAQSSTGPIAVVVEPESPAALAGLREGDLLLEVDGRELASALEAGALVWDAEAGKSLTLKIRRAGVERTVQLLPDWSRRTEPYGYLVIVGLAFWVSGAFIALRWPRIRAGNLYPLLAGCLFAQLTLSHTGTADSLDWAVYWGDVIAGALWPALLLHVGIALTKRTLRWRRTALSMAYGVSATLVLSAAWLSPGALGGAYRLAEPLLAVETRDRLETLVMALAVLFTTVLLVKSHVRSASAMHRSQMRWLLWGLAGGMGPFVTLYAVPWAVGAAELPGWARFLAVLPLLLVPATFTAALARYRLHDLDLLLLRGFSEVTAVFFTFAVLAATIFLLREALSELIPLSRSATRYVGFLAAAVVYPQLRSWVRAAVERAFYRQRYSYRATLLDWARELNTETDLSSLIGRLRSRVRETLGVPEAEVLVRTGPWRFETFADGAESSGMGPLELDEASLEHLDREPFIAFDHGGLPGFPWARYLFALKVKGTLRAVLAIAERERSEEPLTSEDRALLGTLAAHAGTAIEAARLVLEVRQRAAEIERLHARQARILESSAIGLLLLDADERILAWNRALEGIYGLPRHEAIGRRLGEVFPLHAVRRIERAAQARQEESRIFRLTMVNHKDQRVVVNIAISPADSGGGDGGRVVTFDDVTERVALEDQVLQQERLASLGLLAAGVAHEINTPLTGISSYTQLLLEDSEPDDARNAVLQKIEAQTRRASKITNSLLTLARPEKTAFERLDLNEVIQEVLQLFEPQVRKRDVRIRVDLARGLPSVRGHRGKLQQVVLNLLLNARDAVGDDGEIEVATLMGDGRVSIQVTDNGSGIFEDDLPRIFDPFFTTKGRGKGTGLGLSITYGIVQEHDGDVRVESEVDGLTRFRVELPVEGSARAMA